MDIRKTAYKGNTKIQVVEFSPRWSVYLFRSKGFTGNTQSAPRRIEFKVKLFGNTNLSMNYFKTSLQSVNKLQWSTFQSDYLWVLAELGWEHISTWGPNLDPIKRPTRRFQRPLVQRQAFPALCSTAINNICQWPVPNLNLPPRWHH